MTSEPVPDDNEESLVPVNDRERAFVQMLELGEQLAPLLAAAPRTEIPRAMDTRLLDSWHGISDANRDELPDPTGLTEQIPSGWLMGMSQRIVPHDPGEADAGLPRYSSLVLVPSGAIVFTETAPGSATGLYNALRAHLSASDMTLADDDNSMLSNLGNICNYMTELIARFGQTPAEEQ